jgi:hypothetical protein
LQNPSQTNGDNLNSVRNETNRAFRKRWIISERNINELETDSKNEHVRYLYRGIT